MLWAQETILSPASGWGSLILQGGAFGLLSLVVVWLWPREMREQREERKFRDERMQTLTTAFASTITEVSANFGTTLQTVVDTLQSKFEDRNTRIVTALQIQTEKLERGLKENAERIERAVIRADHRP